MLFIAYAFCAFVCVVMLTDYLPNLKSKISKLWFIPGTISLINSIWFIVVFVKLLKENVGFLSGSLMLATLGMNLGVLLPCCLTPIAFFTAMFWVAKTKRVKKEKQASTSQARTTEQTEPTEKAYCSLVKHILLLLFTFGIWNYIWIYRVTEFTNSVDGEEKRNPTNKLLLCMFVPFYSIYWIYKTAQRVDKMANVRGVESNLATLCLILEFVIAFVPPILIQEKINSIITAKPVENSSAKDTLIGVADELKKYSDLLEQGIITQEEFETKKNQLLNI